MEDGGSREGHNEDPAKDAAERYNLSRNGSRHHVAIAYGCHGNDGPPVGGRDAAEVVGPSQLTFSQMDQRGEEGDGHTEKEQKEAKLPGAAADRQSQRLQAQRVASQPHHVQNTQRPQNPQHQAKLVQVALASPWPIVFHRRVLLCHRQRHIVGKDGQSVDDIERPAQEVQLAAGLNESQDELQGEPGHAYGLDDEHVVALGGTLTLSEGIEGEKEKKYESGIRTEKT